METDTTSHRSETDKWRLARQFWRLRPDAGLTAGALLLCELVCGSYAENGWGNSYTIKIESAHVLPDYGKSIAAGDTFGRRFGNAFAVGDFNEDGRLDLVANIHGPDENNRAFAARVYLQEMGGAFAEKIEQPLPTTTWTWTYLAGDYNGDGHLDILMDDMGSDLILLSGNGDGTFKEPVALGLGASGLFAVADLNGDKHLDLVAAKLDGNVGVFLGAGNGTFSLKTTLESFVIPYGPPAGEILIGDLNNDGRLNVTVASVPQNEQAGLGTLDAFLGNGDGTFQEVTRTEKVAARRGALGDFNSDGYLDFAGDRAGPSQLEVWFGQGNGHFAKNRSYSLSYSAVWMVKPTDLNGDGICDLIVSGAPLLPLNIFLGKGDGTFQSRVNFTPVGNYQINVTAPEVVDINGDGSLDIVGLAENLTAQPEEVLTVALSKGVKRDPALGYLLTVDGFGVAGVAPGPIALERTSDFLNWTTLATNAFPFGRWSLTETVSGLANAFYRARPK
jgi:hypothetical protein